MKCCITTQETGFELLFRSRCWSCFQPPEPPGAVDSGYISSFDGQTFFFNEHFCHSNNHTPKLICQGSQSTRYEISSYWFV